ncbi:MAG TPA: GNAT family N-acetyltransferase [Roseiflexaceae bacterium]|nr:GNAT family N-acetyltransferase [Roseiflexaceae bacterium]
MTLIERLQSAMRENARAQCLAEHIPPFTAFFHPRDLLTSLNYAVPDAPLAGDLSAELDALRAAFRRRHRRLRLEFIEEFAPGLGHALLAGGLLEEARQPLMVCTPESWRPPPHVPGLSVAALDATAPLEAIKEYLATNELGFNPQGSGVFSDEDALRFRRELASGRAFTAYLDGQPAGAGMFNPPRGGLAELVGITTLAPFRRRGVATALTAHMARTAFELGASAAFLTAADEAASRVYERAGFRRAGTMLAYIEPLSVERMTARPSPAPGRSATTARPGSTTLTSPTPGPDEVSRSGRKAHPRDLCARACGIIRPSQKQMCATPQRRP